VFSKPFELEGEYLSIFFLVFFVCLFLPSWAYIIICSNLRESFRRVC
jgi:hypothetical protein